MKRLIGSVLPAAVAAILATALVPSAGSAQSSGKTLRFIPEADLRVLDPIWTTAYITRNYGYMVYDTLFAMDENFKVQPQMVDAYTVSGDGLLYTLTLRDGLKFHDGQPVRPADCIASIERWSKRDVFGQKTGEMIAEMKPVDDKTFTIRVKQPYPLLIESLGKLSSNVPFIMPESVAKTDPFKQITEVIGSGPFKFMKDEWVPGNKAVFAKNADYVPRKEGPSWAAGGKVVKVDRVEWVYIPDPATAAAAITAGEVDMWQQLPPDLVPVLQRSSDIVVQNVDPLGSHGILRFNHLHPPFDNPKMRQAVMQVVDQKEYMAAVAGDPKNWKTCYSVYTCGTPLSTEDGADLLRAQRDVAKAKELVKEAGYKGEKVVVLDATDQPIVHSQALVTAEVLKSIGLNVDLQANDWGTLITRRASKEPTEKGGWNIFHTWIIGGDLTNPALSQPLRGAGTASWFGWPTNPKIEQLRDAWFAAPGADEQKKLAEQIQVEAFEAVPYVPTGQFVIPTAYRK
ncbi:MAG: ABC transporter substrate-binding protein, partial [Alphaproteobacteria bacterium]|nr:ABC transporter substrate-binding protein [Alphaproteobacteria bacterium]